MLSVLGGLTLCVQTLPDDVAFVRRLLGLESGKIAVAVARTAPPPVPQAPVIFPSVKIQGIVIRDAMTLEKSNQVKIISLAEVTPAGVRFTSAEK